MSGDSFEVRVAVNTGASRGRDLLLPQGLSTPHETSEGVEVSGGVIRTAEETATGQVLLAVTPTSDRLEARYRFRRDAASYPEVIFIARASRYTRVADDLVGEIRSIGPALSGTDRLRAIASATAERFTYGHPEKRFNDGLDAVPALGCGLTEGSCVDINTYLIAAFRAAGFEAGYVTGYFFPAEKGDWCEDMHCWVLSRHDGEVLEWDVAHHLKMGRRDIEPGLNPKPGRRFAVAHSMGLSVPTLGIRETKLVAEPVWVNADGSLEELGPEIRLFDEAVLRVAG